MGAHRTRIVPLTASILAALLAAPALPRASPGDREETPPAEVPRPLIERAVSELVLIETYVTDTRGRALTGLTADDFILMVDGHKSPIASFELRAIAPQAGGAVTAAQEPAPGEPARPPDLPRRFMLFFEDGTSAPNGLTAARQAAHRFLSSGLVPSDQVGIAAYDTGLRILHDFTTDRDALRGVIDQSLHEVRRISDFAAEQQRHDDEIERLVTEAIQTSSISDPKQSSPMGSGKSQGGAGGSRGQGAGSGGPGPTQKIDGEAAALLRPGDQVEKAKYLAEAYGREEATHLRDVLRAIRTLVDSVAGWRGYKAIVYMGDGMPENPALAYAERILARVKDNRLLLRVASLSLSSDLQALVQAAAARGVTIHSLQTRGLEAGDSRQLRAARRRTDSLRSIALNTGGLASASNDFFQVLQDFDTSSRTYYILGFQPQGPPDGRFHEVLVKCRNRDARVRWRKGFTRLKPEEARERTILAAYTVPEMYSEMGVGLSAVTGPVGRSGRIADLILHVPGDRIVYLPEDGRPTAHLEVGLVAVDDARKETVRASRTLSVALRPEHGRPGTIGIDLVHRVSLPAGSQTITAVVRDGAGGMVGGTRLSLPPAGPTEGRVLGLSIYSLQERSLWIDLPEGDAGTAVTGADREPTIGPALKAVYGQGEPLVCGFRMPEGSGGEGAELRLAIRKGDAIVKIVAIEPRDIGADGKVHVPLPAESIPPGDYTVAVQEVLATGVLDRGVVPLAVQPVEARPL
ncbi:MAG TPA: VWA domain-containing protein [Candidatus Polarisedimenticolia bacterium]|nr:VWA domain-containing protein [Candidatus Polarisedimenticolia bacterium]